MPGRPESVIQASGWSEWLWKRACGLCPYPVLQLWSQHWWLPAFPVTSSFSQVFFRRVQARAGARLADLAAIPSTLVFYEAPHRIVASLEDAREILGEREAVVARELTKLHEEILRGRLSELADRFSQAAHEPRGEMVVVIDRNVIAGSDEETKSRYSVASIVASFEAEGLDARSALKKSARQLGISRDEAYRRLTAERSREKP